MLSYYVIMGFWLNRNNQKRVKLLHCLIFYIVLYGFYTMLVMIVVEYPLIIHWATLTSKLYEFLFLMVRAVHETFSFLFRCSCFSASRKNTHKRVYIWLRAERKKVFWLAFLHVRTYIQFVDFVPSHVSI